MQKFSSGKINHALDNISIPDAPLPTRFSDTVYICGTAQKTLESLPIETGADYWCFAWRVAGIAHATAVFDVHPLGDFRGAVPNNYEELLEERAANGLTTYLQRSYEGIPSAQVFPAKEVLKYFSNISTLGSRGYYFVCSVSWLLGLAIAMGYKRIGLFGVELITNDEYFDQRPNLEHLIGIALGLGIEVDAPEGTSVCSYPALYGYFHSDLSGPVTPELVNTTKAKLEQDLSETQIHQHQIEGAVLCARNFLNGTMKYGKLDLPPATVETLELMLSEMEEGQRNILETVHKTQGALQIMTALSRRYLFASRGRPFESMQAALNDTANNQKDEIDDGN